jgi:hypothetical protein
MEDFHEHSQILPSGSYYTGGQASDTSTRGSGFFDMEDFHEHSQILPSGGYYTGGQAGNTSTRGSGFFDMEDFASILKFYLVAIALASKSVTRPSGRMALTCKTCVYINQLWSTSLLKQLSNFMYWG